MENLWTTQEIDKRVGDNYETMPCIPWNSICSRASDPGFRADTKYQNRSWYFSDQWL